MKKCIVIIFVLILLGCNNENTDSLSETTLTINNMSSYNIFDVGYGSVEFGAINSGNDATENINQGSRYVFFSLMIENVKIRFRTSNIISCEEGKKNELTIINNTIIVNIIDEKTDTLKNIFDAFEFEYNRPQILVKQSNTIITHNGEYHFGKINIGKTKEIIFTIVNTGNMNLNFEIMNNNKINLTDNLSGFFYVNLQPLSSTVVSGNNVTFSIQFSPTVEGNNFSAIVIIKTDSKKNGEFVFRIVGNCGIVYEIGDIGPSGGHIFWVNDGQYKECSEELGVFNLDDANNTAINYNGGNFTGWRLPNRDELELMYTNLHRNGFGGFYSDRYWSSYYEYDSFFSMNRYFLVNFADGTYSVSFLGNNLYNRVRAVRSFKIQ